MVRGPRCSSCILKHCAKGMCRSCYRRATTSKEQYRKNNLKKYGLTEERYEELLARQLNGCAICFSKFANKKHQKLFVDHNHENGKVRGLLCQDCNAGLGRFKENQELLTRAKMYLFMYEDHAF